MVRRSENGFLKQLLLSLYLLPCYLYYVVRQFSVFLLTPSFQSVSFVTVTSCFLEFVVSPTGATGAFQKLLAVVSRAWRTIVGHSR
jgi:hypothetical protein